MKEDCESSELDLPLMSNIDVIHVKHYILNLNCDMVHKILKGSVYFICEPVTCVCMCNKKYLPKTQPSSDMQTSELNLESLTEHKEHSYALELQNFDKQNTGSSHTNKCFEDTVTGSLKSDKTSNRTEISGKTSSTYSQGADSVQDSCQGHLDKTVETEQPEFVMVLDSWSLDVECVSEIVFDASSSVNLFHIVKTDDTRKDNTSFSKKELQMLKASPKASLNFKNTGKSIEIWKANVKCSCQFPLAIEISYCTKPEGPSVKWTKDQDGRYVYTHVEY